MAKRDLPLDRVAVRVLAWVALGLAVLFAVELAIDLSRTDVPLSQLEMTPRAGSALASTVSRAFNNLTAMILTFIALAVPITANMYTPRLIDIFVRDKVNVAAMLFFACMGAHAVWGQALMVDRWSPAATYTALWISGVVGFVVLIPYYFYVLSFLDPTKIIQRVTRIIHEEFDAIVRRIRPAAEARARLNQEILNLGNVILRAVDRTDRDVSLDAILGLQGVVMRYVEMAPRLPPEWFEVEPAHFTGHSRGAIALIVRDRIWVEQKCLHQLKLAYSAALAKMPDAISAITGVNRRIAMAARAKGHDRLLALCVRYFNTFLREAIKRRDAHAVYDIYSQYTFLAIDLLEERPGVSIEIARHFKYYAEFAESERMPFTSELAANDLVGVVEAAYEQGCPRRRELLDVFLSMGPGDPSMHLTKCHARLAAFFRVRALPAEEAVVTAALERSHAMQLTTARDILLGTTDPIFWEVTDRQRNFDYVDSERRDALRAILDATIARKS
jgi:predicted membrane protein DUF2254